MPFVLIAIGIILVVSGVRGTTGQLVQLLSSDAKGFAPWFASILAIGALGYVKPIKPITDAFLILVIVVLFLSNGGFFAKLFGTTDSAVSTANATVTAPNLQSYFGNTGSSNSSVALGSGLSSLLGSSSNSTGAQSSSSALSTAIDSDALSYFL